MSVLLMLLAATLSSVSSLSDLHVAVLMCGGRNEFSDAALVKLSLDFFYSRLEAKVSTILCLKSSQPEIDANYSVIDHMNQYHRMEACYETARTLEIEHGFNFSHYIRTRPDLLWHAPLSPLREYSLDAISVRARVVIFQPPQQIADDAFSWKRNVCCWPRDIPVSSGIKQCVLLDDQVFVVPAHLADAVFRRSLDVSLPPTKASLESYGTNRTTYLTTCHDVFHLPTEMVLTRRFIERNVPYQITPFSGRIKHRLFFRGADSTVEKPCGK